MNVLRAGPLCSLALLLATLTATLAQCGNANGSQPPAASGPQDPTKPPATPAAPPADAVRLLLSGSMLGRLEPCGCASGQSGGLARRMQHVAERRNYDLLLEGGNVVEADTELDLMKLLTASTVLFGMPGQTYDALGVGARDLALPRQEWLAFLAQAPLVASNLASKDEGWTAKPFVEKDVRGVKVRIASFLLALPDALRGEGATVQLVPTADAWTKALDGATADTRRVVLAHGTDTQIRALIPQLQPAPDLVVGVDDDFLEPSASPTDVGGVPLVFAGIRGRVLLAVTLFREAGRPRAICEPVHLPASKTVPGGGGDPDVRKQLLQHRYDVKEAGVLAKLVRQRPTGNGAVYVGNTACKTCHEPAYAVWKDSKHAKAWETLEAAEKDATRYGWPVTAYPDCVSCHVVGYGEQTGFASGEETPDLTDVGCERCHGAGSEHVATGGKKKLGILGGIAPSLLCIQCHDFEQSPTFVYGERWPKIAHGK